VRYLTVRLSPAEGTGFHPLGRRLTEEPAVRREALHHVELLDDGTVLTLAEGRGDRARYEEVVSSSAAVREYMVSGEDRWMAVSRFEPTDHVRRLLEWRRRGDLVVETPVRFEADGAQRLTVLGDDAAFERLFREARGSEAFALDVVRTGEYDPDAERFARALTARQEEVLAAAVDVGYYSAPREATHADVAEAVGLSASTVGDHLRRVEERVFAAMVR
jgi:hypothetical protein